MISTYINRFQTWLQGVKHPSVEGDVFELFLHGRIVGILKREGGEWVFTYSEEFWEQTNNQLIMDFPDPKRIYRSKELWPFFALRIPSPAQDKVRLYLNSTGKESLDSGELLKQFGKRSVANPFILRHS